MKRLLIAFLFYYFMLPVFAQDVIEINNNSNGRLVEALTVDDPDETFKRSVRTREFDLNPQIRLNRKIRLNDVLQLDLFQNRKFIAKVDKLNADVNGTFFVRAKLEGFEHAWCFISSVEGKSLMTIDIPEKKERYVTRYHSGNGKCYLLELDGLNTEEMEGGPSLLPPSEIQQNTPDNNKGHTDGTPYESERVSANDVYTSSVVSVMILYTPSAESWAATYEGGINNTINQIMQKSDLVLGNSNTLVEFDLVYSGQVDYTELNNSTDLTRLTYTNDGYMDNVHTLRNTYGADVVVLLENISFTGGIGWLLNTTAGLPDYAFSITRVQQASWTYTTVHEIGHNMGCHHHKLQTVQPGPGLFPYSAGWKWQGTDNKYYCSVMTYEAGGYFPDGFSATRVPYFSNPAINYSGFPTGHSENGDNARTLREIREVVAAYRTGPCTPPVQQATNFTALTSATHTLSLGWTRGVGSGVLVLASQGGTVNADPVNGTAYTANPQFGSGSQLGTGNYVVYSGPGNSVDVTNLTAGTTYYFAVYEYNSPSECYLIPALTGNGTTLVPPPAPPVALPASEVSQNGFLANWNASPEATTYFLDVSTSSIFEASGEITSNLNTGNVLNYQVNGLSAGTTYYYRVRATNAWGTSGNSNVISVITQNPPPPTAPVALPASNISVTGFQANWDTSAGATTYYLDVSTSPDFEASGAILSNLNTGNVLSYQLNGLSAGTAYYCRVRATNAWGTSGNSNVISVITQTPPPPPAPVALPASNISQTGFQANWDTSAGATTYYLDVSTSPDFEASGAILSNLNTGNVLNYQLNGLAAGTAYYYRVRATNAWGTSGNSQVITVTTVMPAPPPAPVALSASSKTNTGFKAAWNAPSTATGYYLDVSTTNRFTSFVAGYNNLNVNNETSFQVTGLNINTSYYYRVRAYNKGGISPNSNIITVKTLNTVSAPMALPASGITTVSFTANWSVVPEAKGYYLDVSTSGSFSTYITGFKNKNSGNVTSYNVTGLTKGKVYYYRVRAYNGSTVSLNSNVITMTTPVSDALDEFVSSALLDTKGKAYFYGYPNPFGDKIFFNYSVSEGKENSLEILDVTGRSIKVLVSGIQEPGYYRISWDGKGQNNRSVRPGIYIVRFRSGDFTESLKILYQK